MDYMRHVDRLQVVQVPNRDRRLALLMASNHPVAVHGGDLAMACAIGGELGDIPLGPVTKRRRHIELLLPVGRIDNAGFAGRDANLATADVGRTRDVCSLLNPLS